MADGSSGRGPCPTIKLIFERKPPPAQAKKGKRAERPPPPKYRCLGCGKRAWQADQLCMPMKS